MAGKREREKGCRGGERLRRERERTYARKFPLLCQLYMPHRKMLCAFIRAAIKALHKHVRTESLWVCLSLSMSLCLPACLPPSLPACLLVCPFVCPSVSASFALACLSLVLVLFRCLLLFSALSFHALPLFGHATSATAPRLNKLASFPVT